MSLRGLRDRPAIRRRKCTLVGGLVGASLTVVHYWLSGAGNSFPTTLVIAGGFVAGYLARGESPGADAAGAHAGLIGGVPSLVWAAPEVVEVVADWDTSVGAAVFFTMFAVILVATYAGFGTLGGLIGGRLGKLVDERPASAVGS